MCSVGLACIHSAPHPVPQALSRTDKSTASVWVGPWSSGSWFAADRSGEGIILQFLPDGSAAMLWFTYPTANEEAVQAWLSAGGGRVEGDTLVFEQVLQPVGARFGADFDPSEVDRQPWGEMRLRFHDCQRLTLSWNGIEAYADGERELIRLSALDQVDCNQGPTLASTGMRSGGALRSKSGAWFELSRSGEGWVLEELADGRTLVYWFTYDLQGRQAWIVGAGQRAGEQLVVDPLYRPIGTRFGPDFVAADIDLAPWGRLQVDFSGCNQAQLQYQADDPAWGSASREIHRLTDIAGAPCVDVAALGDAAPQWVERSPTPAPASSELAVTSHRGHLYALGGFSAPRSFRRYSPDTDTWTSLPAMPSGRHHLAAFGFEGAIYYVGGLPLGDGVINNMSYRFDLDSQAWSEVPELQSTFGSQAAVLHGQAYVGHPDGRLQQFDPRQRRSRFIAAPNFVERDHAQVVAFLDEIWVIGGRSPETNTVAVYSPVSETWRSGPSFASARGGFSAAVVGPRLFIAGGEVLSPGGAFIEPSSEWIAAGMTSWRIGPALPLGVHGSGGSAVNGRGFHVGGSVDAGRFSGATPRVFELQWPNSP
ncbi:Kelch repeat-containing protein [Pseudomarimonas arenosa]|nr:hypothetical protein [Pseudomarimonas arenosa]